MNLVFFGTPEFAVPILAALLQSKHCVTLAVTQPDRPAGRGKRLQPTPVKALALEHGVPVFPAETLRDRAARRTLSAFAADVFVTAAYGLLLPPKVLAMPRLGCLNIHASLLPKYRGAAPVQAALMNGDTETGVTVMQMDRGMDTGDMLLKRALPIAPEMRYTGLRDALAQLGAEMIMEALELAELGALCPVPQDEAAAVYAPMIAKHDGVADFTGPTERILNQIRAMDPWPGTFAYWQGRVIKFWEAEGVRVCCAEAAAEPGTVLRADEAGLLIRTGDGALRVTEMQAEGGKRMRAADYLRGRPIKTGMRFTRTEG